MANAVSELWVVPCSGPVVIAVQAVPTFVPGCSGKVEPGAPWSANAGEAAVAQRARAAAPTTRRRFIGAPFREANAPVARVSAVAADLTLPAGPARTSATVYPAGEPGQRRPPSGLPEGWYDSFGVAPTPFFDRIGNREGVGFEHRARCPTASLEEADPGGQSSISGLGRESVARLVTLTGPIGANQPYEEAVRHVRITAEKGLSLHAVLDRVRRSARVG
jgi:hypothetical protein